MLSRYVKYSIAGLILFLALYLGTVWVWANSAAPDLLDGLPFGDRSSEVHPHHLEALIKIEDPTFYSHPGLDVSSGQGLTTITSVVAKIVFLGDHQLEGLNGRLQLLYRKVFTCCKRIDLGRDIMALALNRHVAKQDQLDIFLSSAYLGSSSGEAVVGFEKAAAVYYGKGLDQLTDDEFYGIVAMLIAPNRYHPIEHPEIHAQRLKRVKAVITGHCKPNGWFDLTYKHCAAET